MNQEDKSPKPQQSQTKEERNARKYFVNATIVRSMNAADQEVALKIMEDIKRKQENNLDE